MKEMNALYLILIVLGFTAGILMSSFQSNENIENKYTEEIEIKCSDELDYEVDAEAKTFNLLK